MRIVPLLGAVLLAASMAGAQEPAPHATEPLSAAAAADALPAVPSVVPEIAERAVAAPEMATEARDPFQRGSFWWYVGIIVVAGVILAVVV